MVVKHLGNRFYLGNSRLGETPGNLYSGVSGGGGGHKEKGAKPLNPGLY